LVLLRNRIYYPLYSLSVLLAAKDRVLHTALLFGLLTGMRSGEICGLMAEDITAKGNLGRFVSIRRWSQLVGATL
jgi:integrase